MIKAIVVFRRKPGMDLEAFHDYWLNQHPEAVLKMPGLVRYCQNHPIRDATAVENPAPDGAWDGVAETWWESMTTIRENAAHPAFEALCEDEARFIDRASMLVYLVDEHVVIDGPSARHGIKRVALIVRRPDMDPTAFRIHWREPHGPLVAGLPGLRRYEQNPLRPGAYRDGRQPAFDGLALTWFDTVDDMRASDQSPERVAVREDEPHFIDPVKLRYLVTREHVIKASRTMATG